MPYYETDQALNIALDAATGAFKFESISGGAPLNTGGNVASGTADSGNPVKVGGKYNATLPTFANGNRADAQMDINGRLITADNAVGFASNLSGTSPAAAGTVASTTITGLAGYRSGVVAATLQGATGDVLDVYIQTSPDAGVTWVDYIHFPQLAAGAAAITYRFGFGNYISSSTPVVVGKNLTPALAANTAANGDFGDRMRAVYVAGAVTTVGAAETILLSFST